jgi:hypothetical protein
MVAANSSSSTMVAANSQWLVLSICCTCNGNNPTLATTNNEMIKANFQHNHNIIYDNA